MPKYCLAIIVIPCFSCTAIVRGMLEPGDGAVNDGSDSGDLEVAADETTGIDSLDGVEAEPEECLPPLQDCGGQCTDTMTDRRNCGACGTVCEAPSFCQDGFCACPSGIAGWMECDGECVNIMTNPMNCGGCGFRCESFEVCDGRGSCSGSCAEGFVACEDTSGARTCADLMNDPFNCGSCGNACPFPPFMMVVECVEGDCSFTCEAGWVNTNGIRDDGCECYRRPEACNGSDDDCDTEADEDFQCVRSAQESCNYPSSTCRGTRTCTDSCTWSECTVECFPTGSSGSCTVSGTSCPGTRTCSAGCTWGECADTCPVDCCPSGCTDKQTDENNCGTCGTICPGGDTCIGGRCVSPDASEDVVEDPPDEPDIPEEIEARDMEVS